MNATFPEIRKMSELDRLPWFDKDDQGRIRLSDDCGVPEVFDIHSHVGWSYGLSRRIDLSARTPDTAYFYDYESDQDILLEENHPTPAETKSIGREMWGVLFKPGRSSLTHTAANYAAEMDRFNYRHACLLPIEIPFFRRHADETLAAAQLDPRFIPFAAVYPFPWNSEKEARLESLLAAGTRAVKLHPEFQLIAPNGRCGMKLFEWCAAKGVPVLAHCGYTGSEPALLRSRAEPDRFREPLRAFPDLRILLGHTGLRCHEKTLAVARDFSEQVWLDVSGQAVPVIRQILDKYDLNRILYGSDWPFYPLAVAMARPLAATEDRPEIRQRLFFDNAKGFLGM